jgi:hypothetical protein
MAQHHLSYFHDPYEALNHRDADAPPEAGRLSRPQSGL